MKTIPPTPTDEDDLPLASVIELAKGKKVPPGATTVGVNGAKKIGGVGALQ